MADRFQVNGNIYRVTDLMKVTLKDTFVFNEQVFKLRQTEPDFPDIQWVDLEIVGAEVDGLKPEEAQRHPRANLLMVGTIWLATRNSEHKLTVSEVVDLDPAEDIVWLPDTEDAKKANPTKRKPSPKASVPAASPAEAEALPS